MLKKIGQQVFSVIISWFALRQVYQNFWYTCLRFEYIHAKLVVIWLSELDTDTMVGECLCLVHVNEEFTACTLQVKKDLLLNSNLLNDARMSKSK